MRKMSTNQRTTVTVQCTRTKLINHKYKTIHRCFIYHPHLPELQIFELTRTKTKDKQSVITRMLKENPETIISLRAKVNSKKKHTVEDKPSEPRLQYFSNSNTSCTTKQRTILQIPVPQTYKNFNNIKTKKA